MHEGAKTLVDVIDKTISPMGARLLRRWIVLPLKEEKAIKERLNGVEYFFQHPDEQDELATSIRQVGDLERIISKLAMNRISPREVVQLKNALIAIPNIKQICEQSEEPTLLHISDQLNPCNSIRERITKELNEEAPAMVQKGNVIAPGVSAELDELRNIMTSGKDYLNYVQQRESERTGIPSLKVHFNNVFGYYIEVRNTHKDKVPSDWIRKQTLVSAERYITEELKEYESKILGAEEKILQLETNLFNDLIIGISEFINAIQLNAVLVARLDCLQSFATIARLNKYNKPEINNTEILNIKDGRHPVIETQLSADSPYIANDVYLDNSDQQIIIITGPNMSGKSALLRQTALIVLLAQMGSFVPAASAEIGLVDKIFTRVGASDNISVGESTFMVEMLETASILNNVSSRSLILLDEIGRGTSTYDGISIAWAMVEYLHEHPSAKAKTLFATHYHELNEMEKSFGRIKNFNVSIKELDKKILFLRKLVPGGSEHSFGIHVARMAGMPRSVVQRAEDILKEMEASQRTEAPARPSSDIGNKREGYQLSFFQLDDPVLKQIRDEIKHININSLTPLEALNKLSEIKKLAGL
jgi:DNA mismatch repair protein MutS